MAIPIAFIHGTENGCFLPEGIMRAVARLSSANGASLYTNHPIPHYGRIDCIFGRDAVKDVFPVISAHLEGAGA
ncbi:MAG TPA: hypothetical protein VHV28_13790 [Solirubrobacteraceae bacterium]|jgi:cholesterol oxidase|nr:hypothetical protein [Solirubrobacteraceae bacterium]